VRILLFARIMGTTTSFRMKSPMHRTSSFRFPSPDLAFDIVTTAMWVLLVFQVSTGLVAPRSEFGLVS
jgi:hypothetical protein